MTIPHEQKKSLKGDENNKLVNVDSCDARRGYFRPTIVDDDARLPPWLRKGALVAINLRRQILFKARLLYGIQLRRG